MKVNTDAPVLILHSSNELYGADKILVEVVKSMPTRDRARTVVWLPDDLVSSENRLGALLDELSVDNQVVPTPVLRRKHLTVRGILPLLGRALRSLLKMRRLKADVVYCTTSAMIICLGLARLAGAKRVILHLQEIWGPREAMLLGFFARGAHEIFCISTAARDSLPAHIRDRAFILTNAHNESTNAAWVAPQASSPMRYVVASRWNSWKGHEGLIAAWNEETCPGELTILGGKPSMGEAVNVEELVSKVIHRESIKIVGEVSDIAPYLDAADLLVLPSEKPEPFGLVLLEAFARGRGVIASNAGGVLDIVTHDEDGMLYPLGDSNHLTVLLRNMNKDVAQRLGRNARLTYEQRFSIIGFRRRFLELWQAGISK